MPPSCRSASGNLYVPVEPTALLYKEGSETLRRARRDTDSLVHLQLGFGETGNLLAQGLLVNPAALIPVTQPGDLRQDRVEQLVKRVFDGVASDETRRAYGHALEMFLAFCGREGNPTLSAELVASYRVSLVGEGKSSSTVGVHLAAIKALPRAAVLAGLMAAETAASINDVKGAPRRGNRIGNWLTGSRRRNCFRCRTVSASRANAKIGSAAQRANGWVLVDIHRGRHHRGEDLSRGAQGRQSLGGGFYARRRAADRSATWDRRDDLVAHADSLCPFSRFRENEI